jgi:hypothetical protein
MPHKRQKVLRAKIPTNPGGFLSMASGIKFTLFTFSYEPGPEGPGIDSVIKRWAIKLALLIITLASLFGFVYWKLSGEPKQAFPTNNNLAVIPGRTATPIPVLKRTPKKRQPRR